MENLRVHGVPKPKGTGWLKEVKVDAARAAIQHLHNQKERQEFELAKARGITPEEILAKGRTALGLPGKGEYEYSEDADDDAPDDTSTDDQGAEKPLNKMSKAELLEVADEEGVEFSNDMTVAQLREAIAADRKENE